MINKFIIRDNFSRIAKQYEEKAILQERIGKLFLNKIDPLVKKADYILDVGCATAKLTKELSFLNPNLKILAPSFPLVSPHAHDWRNVFGLFKRINFSQILLSVISSTSYLAIC